MGIYNIRKNFLSNEQYGLIIQINHAVIPVALYLALGSLRISKKDQVHFSQISYSSLMEVVCQLNIAKELRFIKEELYTELHRRIAILSSKINALQRSQKKE